MILKLPPGAAEGQPTGSHIDHPARRPGRRGGAIDLTTRSHGVCSKSGDAVTPLEHEKSPSLTTKKLDRCGHIGPARNTIPGSGRAKGTVFCNTLPISPVSTTLYDAPPFGWPGSCGRRVTSCSQSATRRHSGTAGRSPAREAGWAVATMTPATTTWSPAPAATATAGSAGSRATPATVPAGRHAPLPAGKAASGDRPRPGAGGEPWAAAASAGGKSSGCSTSWTRRSHRDGAPVFSD